MKPSLSGVAAEVRTAGFAFPQAQRRPTIRLNLARRCDLALLPALALLVAVGAFVSPDFLTRANLVSVLGATSALALVVLAESLIVLVGRFDLSLESTVGFAPALGAMLAMPVASGGYGWAWSAAAGLVLVVAAGAAIGWINGLLVVRLRLNAFVATLAMLIVLRGMLAGLTRGGTVSGLPRSFYALATTTALGLPISVWVAAASFAVAAFVLRYHRLGRALYAIGGSPEAARAAGISVERIVWGVFVIGGVLAAVGGIAAMGYSGTIDPNRGNGMIFTVFAAAVIGGISLDGGKGTVLGALAGAILLGVAQNLLTLAHVPSFWVQAIYGAVILGSLTVAKLAGGDA